MNELNRPVSDTVLDKEMWARIFPSFRQRRCSWCGILFKNGKRKEVD
jgi:hypothetical protein